MEILNIIRAGDSPLIATAIHDGHGVRKEVLPLLAVDEKTRFREEDPYTGIMSEFTGNRIISKFSRFEYDLNRPPEKAVYIVPEDAWGIRIWKAPPPEQVIRSSRELYAEAYDKFRELINVLLGRHGRLVIYDLHSYNYRRNGPDAQPEDPDLNPEINVGTGTMDREYWSPVIDRFLEDLKQFNFMGRKLDVRENIKFRGGYFPKWIHGQFGKSVCCLSIEFKKFFMDEWTGKPDYPAINALKEALADTVPGVLEQLSGMN